jgi:hypothetical protein
MDTHTGLNQKLQVCLQLHVANGHHIKITTTQQRLQVTSQDNYSIANYSWPVATVFYLQNTYSLLVEPQSPSLWESPKFSPLPKKLMLHPATAIVFSYVSSLDPMVPATLASTGRLPVSFIW